MTEPGSSEVTLDSRLNRILAEFIEAQDAGKDASLETWIRRFPEFEQPLRDFVSSNRRLNQIVPRHSGRSPADENSNATLSGAAKPSIATPLPDRLRYFGDYDLIEEVARGGMGVVYRGRQVSLNRPVAVKMILAGKLVSPEDLARFRFEAEAAANLDHPGIVPIYEIGEHEGVHYLSMKYIDGESLAQRLRKRALESQRRGQRTEQIREDVRLVVAVARAAHFAHQRGIIHRDLKPANILIDHQGQPHVTDFGLAKRIADDSHLTHTGAIVGTPSFMAPEQARGIGRGVTTAADIYGLGAILYASLANRPPFEGDSPFDVLMKVQNELPQPLRRCCPTIEPALESICEKCLAKDPEDRYRSAGELADDLERWLRGEPISIAPPGIASLFWRWLSTNFRAAACVLILGLMTGWLVSETARVVLAQNLSPYLGIYRSSFSQRDPPEMLKLITAYPRWIPFVALPLSLLFYLGMGWLTDILVRPRASATAVLTGMGLGSAGAITAFMTGIGWVAINQVAVWPAQPDLELLAATIDKNTTFTDGRMLADTYPHVPARQVMKKALVDVQARVPLSLWYGLLFSMGILFLPATFQVWVAFALRQRGDASLKRLLELIEVFIPLSLLLIGWGFLLAHDPLLGLTLVAVPVSGYLLWERARHCAPAIRRFLSIAMIAIGLVGLGLSASILFSPAPTGGFSLGLLTVGTIAAACAVFQRWPWWMRLIVYAVWLTTFTYVGGVRGTLDANENRARMIVCLIGSIAIALLSGLQTWLWSSRQSARPENSRGDLVPDNP